MNYINSIKNSITGDGLTRIFGLDLLRSIAILLVLVSHGRHFFDDKFGEKFKLFGIGGFLGVELFFVLSGFLIGGILIKIIAQSNTEYGYKEIKHFWIRRWYRTLPNYYLVLLINSCILSIIAGHFVFNLKYVFFLQNFLKPIADDMNYAQSWSLTIEEWFYMLTPVFFLLFIRITKLSVKSTLLLAIMFALTLYPFFKLLYSYLANKVFAVGYNVEFSVFRSVTVLRLDSLLYGVLIAYFNYFHKVRLDKFKIPLLITGVLIFALCSIYVGKMQYMNIERPGLLINILFPTITSIAVCLMLPFFNNLKLSNDSGFVKFITATSILSYSLYLIHWSIVIPFVNIFSLNPFVLFLLFWILSYLLSAFNYYYFERRMTKLRDGISTG